MLDNEIDRIGNVAYFQSLKHQKRQGRFKNALTGAIDMEYDKEGLISVQIGIKNREFIFYYDEDFDGNNFYIKDLNILIKKCLDTMQFYYKSHKRYRHLFLASYWSTAELSQIKNFWEDSRVRNVSQSLMNISFNIHPKTFNVTILDIFHFFSDLKTKRKDLDTIAKLYGLEGKISLERFKGKSEEYWKKHMRELLNIDKNLFERYALQDIRITKQLIEKHRNRVFNETGIDIYNQKTNGSIAISFFRQNKMAEGEIFGNRNTKSRRFILKCSHGAVMCALKRGWVKQVYENDFSGFYTRTSVNTKLLPKSEKDIIFTNDLDEILDNAYDGWTEVYFKFPKKFKYPTLPVQEYHPYLKKPSMILFPRCGISFCTVSEIRTALDFGAEIDLLGGYYYNEGTDSWSEFAEEQMKLREEAQKNNDEIGSAIHKNMPNAAVGKLFQHKGGFDIENTKLISKFLKCDLKNVIENNLSISNIDSLINYTTDKTELKLLKKIKKNGTNDNVRIGVAWLPEWWSIILGRARAVLWWVVNKYGTDPVHLSTDSFHDVSPLNGDIETPFGAYKIEEKEISSGKDMFIVRTKLNVHGDNIVHHSLHLPQTKAKEIIINNQNIKYERIGRCTIRDGILNNNNFGKEKVQEMSFQTGWDNKMKIITNYKGEEEFEVWENIEEFFDFVDADRLTKIRDRAMIRHYAGQHRIARDLERNISGDWYEEDRTLEDDERDEDVIREAMRWMR